MVGRSMRSLIACALLACTQGAAAAALLLPAVQGAREVAIGDPVDVDITLVGRGSAFIGEFDMLVDFDPAVLAFRDAAFGAEFADFFATFEVAPGSVEAAAFSLLPDLGAVQTGPDVFLFSMRFEAVGLGVSPIALSPFAGPGSAFFVGDELGNPVVVDEVRDDAVTVRAPSAPVPAPATAWLVALGLSAWAARRRPRSATRARSADDASV